MVHKFLVKIEIIQVEVEYLLYLNYLRDSCVHGYKRNFIYMNFADIIRKINKYVQCFGDIIPLLSKM